MGRRSLCADRRSRKRPRRVRGATAPGLAGSLALALALAVAACDGDGPTEPGDDGPPQPAAVEVTSPIGDVMAVDFSVQLAAVATDATGSPMTGRTFTWASSNESVATAGGTGLVQGLADGTTRISATTGGVTGSFDMRVLAADLDALEALLGDPFTDRLVAALGATPRGEMEGALGDCDAAVPQGNILALVDCTGRVQDAQATDPTDQALVAVLALIGLRAELFLAL